MINKKFVISLEVYDVVNDKIIDSAGWRFESNDDKRINEDDEFDYKIQVLKQLNKIIKNHFRQIKNSNK